MEWNVYVSDFNAREIKAFNVLKHYGFYNDCKKITNKKNVTKEEFTEEIRRSLAYFYRFKCEWEIVLSDFPPHESFHKAKIDVYSQVMLNFDKFIVYLWENKEKI